MIGRLRMEGTDEAVERAENLLELVAAAREFDEAHAGEPPPRDPEEPVPPPLARFLEGIALLGEADAPTPEGRVAMMTLHAAKGLEFEAVVLAGLEEGVLPYARPWRRPESEEARRADDDEERRLCYVGMTRAKRLLVLSLARRRMTYGEGGAGFRQQEPSRFLADLPPELFGLRAGAAAAAAPRIRRHPGALEGEPVIELDEGDGWHEEARPPPAARVRPPAATEARTGPRVEYDQEHAPPASALAPGDRVVHAELGEGVVRASEGGGPNAKVTVAFYARGEKRVIARFLRRVE
jgi:DNA helicase-2/ATP-dependent DNA helicase PcrA